MLSRVALEYGQTLCASATIASAAAWSTPAMVTSSATVNVKPPLPFDSMPTVAATSMSLSRTFVSLLRVMWMTALPKQAA